MLAHQKRNPLLSLLSGEQVAELLRSGTLRERRYIVGEIIARQGEAYTELILLAAGKVETTLHSPDGRSLQVDILEAPDVLAPAILCAPDSRMPVEVRCRSDVLAYRLAKKDFLQLCCLEPLFLEAFLSEVGLRFTVLSDRLKRQRFSSLSSRVALHVLETAGENDLVEQGREEMAAVAGSTRPALSRILSTWAHDGIIAFEGRVIRIIERQELQEIAEGE